MGLGVVSGAEPIVIGYSQGVGPIGVGCGQGAGPIGVGCGQGAGQSLPVFAGVDLVLEASDLVKLPAPTQSLAEVLRLGHPQLA